MKKFDAKNPYLAHDISRTVRTLELCKEEIKTVPRRKDNNYSVHLNTILKSSWTQCLESIRGIECLIQPYMYDWIHIPQETKRQLEIFCHELHEIYTELCLIKDLSMLTLCARSGLLVIRQTKF
jgi:hypothetical protein